MIIIQQIIDIIEQKAPIFLSLPEDNNGLQIGSLHTYIKNILITLDITDEVINEAIKKKCNLIISHHPFIFTPIFDLNILNYKTNQISQLLKHKISVYVAHTNMDSSSYGINYVLAQKIGLKNVKPISQTILDEFKKLVIFIPVEYKEKVRNKLLSLDLFKTDKYSKMSFISTGEGTFLPDINAKPFIGTSGKIEKTEETRLEVLVNKNSIIDVLNEIRSVHPYEEMAYDIYPVETHYFKCGIGAYGEIEKKINLQQLCNIIKDKFDISVLRIIGDPCKKIKKIGIISGSGASYLQTVEKLNLDVLITGDIKYHDALKANDLKIAIIDAGHYGTEKIFKDIVYDILEKEQILTGKNKLYKSTIKTDPFNIL
ncbi:MAG: Nif3-like dinuclear metal center hexameric protein [Candidatus Firestonebacteria bacterium]|nr:Nif3-like dinuclear metal center hexameric protein [Candidatus Firestonebacteria bacterium]